MQIYRNEIALIDVVPEDSSYYRGELMGDESITLNFSLPQPVAFQIGDYATLDGQRYTLNKQPKETKLGERNYSYSLTMQADFYELKKTLFMYGKPSVVGGYEVEKPPYLPDFSFMGDIALHLNLLLRNIRRTDTGWSWQLAQGYTPVSVMQTISFDSEDCLSVLKKIVDAFSTEYTISGKVITIGKKADAAICNMGYGKGNGFTEITRTAFDDSQIVTKIHPFGSDKNLDRSKYLTLVNSRLATEYELIDSPKRLLPRPGAQLQGITVGNDFSISANTELYGVSEQVVKFDEVYPGNTPFAVSTVIAVDDSKGLYDVTCAGIDFDVKDCLIDGVTASVKFNTGQLAGYEFSFNWVNADKRFELVPIEEDGYVLPKGSLIPSASDEFIITGINFPTSYFVAAEDDLLEASINTLVEKSVPGVSYEGKVDKLYFKKYAAGITPRVGDQINFTDSDLGINTTLRITAIKRGVVNRYDYELTLSNISKVDQFAQMVNSVRTVGTKIYGATKLTTRTLKRDLVKYYTWIRYADDANGTGISNDPTGKGYIGFAYNKTTAVESDNPADYTWSQIKGDKGDAGVGEPGADGVTHYTWIKYSNNADGTDLYDTPNESTLYIGIAVNKTSAAESSVKTDYTWSKFKGDQGVPGNDGQNGQDGGQGPVLVFRGDYSAGNTYYGNNSRIDVVKYESAYYKTISTAGTFTNVLPTDTGKWESFGAEFESVATNLLLAENANIADWIIKSGKITSQQVTSDNTPRAQLDGNNGAATFASDGINTPYGSKSVKQTIEISSANGRIEARTTGNDVAHLSSQGIFANCAGQQVLPGTAGITALATIGGLGYGDLEADIYGTDFVCGVYGDADNSNANPAPAFGGYFRVAKIVGECYGVRRITAGVTLTRFDRFVTCYNTSTIALNLPANPYEGQIIEIRRMNSAAVTVNGNGTQIHGKQLYDVNTDFSIGGGLGDCARLVYDGQYWCYNNIVREA